MKTTLQPVKSSNIHSIGYDQEKKELHIKFHSGGQGYYQNVSEATFNEIMASPSKGAALHTLVKKHPKKHPWVSH